MRMAAVRDDEEFVEVERTPQVDGKIDTEMTNSSSESSSQGLGLRRMSANDTQPGSQSMDEEDDESSPLHPLMSRLQNRLLSRNSNVNRAASNKFDTLHPYTSILSVANVNDCVELENSACPENERCSREKLIYRLTQCPELSLGIFSRPIPSEATAAGDQKPKLIAYIAATRSAAPCVTDASMEVPENWRERRPSPPKHGDEEPKGHQETGGTICLHSLAVLEEHQKKGLGSILIKAYIQRIKDAKIAERVALLAHDHLIKFYVGMGFENMGDSQAMFGGGGWNNMILQFNDSED